MHVSKPHHLWFAFAGLLWILAALWLSLGFLAALAAAAFADLALSLVDTRRRNRIQLGATEERSLR